MSRKQPAAKPDHVSQEDWDEVDSPPIAPEQFAEFHPAKDMKPDLVARMKAAREARAERRGRGPQKAPTKISVTIRLDQDIVDAYKASGRGWQGRLNDDLRRQRLKETA